MSSTTAPSRRGPICGGTPGDPTAYTGFAAWAARCIIAAKVANANKELVRNWIDFGWNQKKDQAVEVFFAEDFMGYDPYEGRVWGRDGVASLRRAFLRAFPDLEVRLDDQVAEGDLVIARVTATGTHRGELLGVPATGRRVTIPAMMQFRIEDGTFREAWRHWDAFGAIQQVGGLDFADLPYVERDLPASPETHPGILESERELNKAAVRCLVDGLWNPEGGDLVNGLVLQDSKFLDADTPPGRGPAGWRSWAEMLGGFFSPVSVHIDDLIADGDKVAYRFSLEAMNIGSWLGFSPTRSTVSAGGIVIARMSLGCCIEAWQVWDVLRVHKQIEQAQPKITTTEAVGV